MPGAPGRLNKEKVIQNSIAVQPNYELGTYLPRNVPSRSELATECGIVIGACVPLAMPPTPSSICLFGPSLCLFISYCLYTCLNIRADHRVWQEGSARRMRQTDRREGPVMYAEFPFLAFERFSDVTFSGVRTEDDRLRHFGFTLGDAGSGRHHRKTVAWKR